MARGPPGGQRGEGAALTLHIIPLGYRPLTTQSPFVLRSSLSNPSTDNLPYRTKFLQVVLGMGRDISVPVGVALGVSVKPMIWSASQRICLYLSFGSCKMVIRLASQKSMCLDESECS